MLMAAGTSLPSLAPAALAMYLLVAVTFPSTVPAAMMPAPDAMVMASRER